MKILHMTLKKKWFDMILSGEKTEEYREIKPYWNKRLFDDKGNLRYDTICFKNGYNKDSPSFLIELKGIRKWTGNIKWGAPYGELVYILELGKTLKQQ